MKLTEITSDIIALIDNDGKISYQIYWQLDDKFFERVKIGLEPAVLERGG